LQTAVQSILEPLGIAIAIAMIDVIIAMIITIVDPTASLFLAVSGYLIFEFGLMLILGTCFMARQPLEVEKRFDEQGVPVRSWIWAMRGKKVLLASIFVLIFAFCFGGLGTLF
jgi:hypothetical protein